MTVKKGLFVPSLFIAGMLAVQAQAQTTTTAGTTAAAAEEVLKEESKPFGITLGIQTDSSLQAADDVSRSASTTITIAPTYKINERLKLSSSLLLIRDHEDRSEPNKTSNLKLTLSHSKFEIDKRFSFTPAVAARAPTNREARNDDRFQGSFSLEPRIDYAPEGDRFSGFFRLATTRNIHEQTLDRNFSPNIQYIISNSIGLNYQLTDELSVSTTGDYVTSFTYRDFQRNRFGLTETIAYQLNKELGLEVGHSNSGNALKPNLRDSNIAAFSDTGSVLFIGANYVF